MTNLITTKKSPKAKLSPAQTTFERLKKKIKTLETQVEQTKDNLEILLQFNYSHIEPARKNLLRQIAEIIKITYGYHKKNKAFSPKERKTLKEMLLNKIDELMSLGYEPEDGDPELEAILKKFEDPNAADEEAMMSEMMGFFKDKMTESFKKEGVDIDLSNINAGDSEEEMMDKLFEALQDAMENEETIKFDNKPKTKAQLQKELKEKELENLQKQGLGKIYKDLAKAIHPDLEQDPKKKLEKEEVMKRLTTAYEKEDLHELLKIELEWMAKSENGSQNKKQSDDQLKIYNSILKDQIEELKDNIELMFLQPRYAPLRNFQSDNVNLPLLHRALAEFNKGIAHYQGIIQKLRSQSGLEAIKHMIAIY